MINDRITKLSHDQDSFNQASPLYAEALKNIGDKANMKYNKPASVELKNNRETNAKNKTKRNIIWFNPPYNKEVQTNLGKAFFNLINKHIPHTTNSTKYVINLSSTISKACQIWPQHTRGGT